MFGRSTEEKRAYIAKIAGEVFSAKGFKESSLQDVSAKGNLSKAGIYHYFKTKEEILLFILLKNTDQGMQVLEDSLKKSAEQQLDEVDSFKELFRTYANYLLNNRKVSLLVLRERHQVTGKSRKIILERERDIFSLLKEKLTCIPGLKKKLNINLIVFQFISMIHWMGYWFDEKKQLNRHQAIDQILEIVFNGILES
ncbi:MAG: TetR/AcrR family transcriptional regulator [Desulfobacteraceae bacterium]|nr:MAG: TetR/AcrR family transcriptional regulator [Desulfobacteraceae bacterium]